MNYVETINKEVMGMAEGLVASLPSLAIGLVIILVTWLVAKIVVRITGRQHGGGSHDNAMPNGKLAVPPPRVQGHARVQVTTQPHRTPTHTHVEPTTRS